MNIRRYFDWRAALAFLVIAATVGFVGTWWLDIPYWLSVCIVAAALLINGVIALVEDKADAGPKATS